MKKFLFFIAVVFLSLGFLWGANASEPPKGPMTPKRARVSMFELEHGKKLVGFKVFVYAGDDPQWIKPMVYSNWGKVDVPHLLFSTGPIHYIRPHGRNGWVTLYLDEPLLLHNTVYWLGVFSGPSYHPASLGLDRNTDRYVGRGDPFEIEDLVPWGVVVHPVYE